MLNSYVTESLTIQNETNEMSIWYKRRHCIMKLMILLLMVFLYKVKKTKMRTTIIIIMIKKAIKNKINKLADYLAFN